MSTNSIKATPQNPKNEVYIQISGMQINANNQENTNTTSKESKSEKIENSNEIVVKIEESLQENLKKNVNDKDFMVYGYHGQNQILPTTWVYFQQGGGGPQYDGSAPLDYTPDRNAFVRLVFIIVFIMIAVTAALNIIVFMSDALSDIFKEFGLFLSLAAMALMIGLNYAMACSACTRVMPCNIICLVLAVIGMSILCCYVTIRYDTRIVMLAVAATAGVVLFCILLACTSFDFTKWLLYVIVVAAAFGIAVMISSLYMLISGNYIKMLHLVMLCGGTIISTVILTIELQMILGGRTVELSEDDYAMGAFLLYTSIIDIFLKLVQIMGIIDDW